jgi:hypothetical protein
MSSYSGNPSSTPKDGIRFLIGDTGPTTFSFTDEEILFAIKTQANIWMAAALFADKLTTLKSSGGLSSKSVGSLSESYSQGSIAFYQTQAKMFRSLGSGHQVPTVAEISQKFSFRQFDGLGGRGPRVRDDEDWPPKDEEQTW